MMWSFKINPRAEKLCSRIAGTMVHEFGITLDEAEGRINQFWEMEHFLDEKDIRFHETAFSWANNIYYGSDSQWWKNPEGLTPRPFTQK